MIVIALRDKVEDSFRSLTLDVNEEAAKRNFSYAVNNSSELLFKSKDLELYSIGDFDHLTGSLKLYDIKHLICTGDQVIAHD